MAILCPECGKVAPIKHTKYGVRRDCCGLWSWGKDAPLVDAETHQARKAAHAALDRIWAEGHLDRRDAYKKLAEDMDLTPKECHIKTMDKETARKVPGVVESWGY